LVFKFGAKVLLFFDICKKNRIFFHFANSTLQNEDFLHFPSFLFAYSKKFAILQFVRIYAFLCAAHYSDKNLAAV